MGDLSRLISKVDSRQLDAFDCWEWRASTVTNGCGNRYGQFWLRGKRWLAHRASLVVHGRASERELRNKCVNHLCCNTLCVNPNHLEVCTQSENLKYMHYKQRGNPGGYGYRDEDEPEYSVDPPNIEDTIFEDEVPF